MIENAFDKFTTNAKSVLKEAQRIATNDGKPVSTVRLLLAIIEIPGSLSHDILNEYSVTTDQIKLIIDFEAGGFPTRKESLTKNFRAALKESFKIALEFEHSNVDVEHILIALVSNESFGSYNAIKKVGVDPLQIRGQMIKIFEDLHEMDEMIRKQSGNNAFGAVPMQHDEDIAQLQSHLQNDEPDYQQAPIPQQLKSRGNRRVLDYFGVDLVKRAKNHEIDPVIGRDNEITRSIQILLRKTKNNPVFIGDPGVGKTAIVEALSQRIADKKVPAKLRDKKIFQIDLGLLVAGTIYRGQFEDRIKKILQEVKTDKNTIIFIDELHSIVGTGSAEGSMDAANLLKPALSRGEIRLIGATTFDEYRKHIEKDSALERRLQPIVVLEPSVEETIKILKGIKPIYEKHHGVIYENSAIESAAILASKYINDRRLPDKAIDLIDEAASAKVLSFSTSELNDEKYTLEKQLEEASLKKERLIVEEKFEQAARAKQEESKIKEQLKRSSGQESEFIVTDHDIAALISQITGIPVGEIADIEAKNLRGIEKKLSSLIVDQNEPIREVAKVLRRNRSGISAMDRPMGSFLFLGPSGVGKTYLAKVLAKNIFGRDSSLIKLDMSEFMERHNAARLTGAPPGYVGYEDAGKLTEQVRKNPYSIILFDEIEKAHPEVFNLLLQVLDEGKLTDSQGKVVNFKNTIVILTSNIGIEQYKKLSRIGFHQEISEESNDNSKQAIKKEVSEIFRPEFLNRLDKVIFFNPLNQNGLEKIAKIKLKELQERLLVKKIKIKFSASIIKFLTSRDFDNINGARPLIREIENEVENFISDKILNGELKGTKESIIEVKNGKLEITKPV